MNLTHLEDPCRRQWKQPSTNAETIYAYIRSKESHHRLRREMEIYRETLTLQSREPLSHLYSHDVQEFYNKATVVYWADHRQYLEYYGRWVPNATRLQEAMMTIYPTWWSIKGHNTDIEFGRFVAKTIKLEDPDHQPQSAEEVLTVHQELCKQLWATEPLPGTNLKSPYNFRTGFEEDPIHSKYYKLRPLLRAIIVFIDNPDCKNDEMHVKMIKTGCTEGLTAPINFSPIESEIIAKNEDGSIVTVALQTAIKFITNLEEHERVALPGKIDEEGQEIMRKIHLERVREHIN